MPNYTSWACCDWWLHSTRGILPKRTKPWLLTGIVSVQWTPNKLGYPTKISPEVELSQAACKMHHLGQVVKTGNGRFLGCCAVFEVFTSKSQRNFTVIPGILPGILTAICFGHFWVILPMEKYEILHFCSRWAHHTWGIWILSQSSIFWILNHSVVPQPITAQTALCKPLKKDRVSNRIVEQNWKLWNIPRKCQWNIPRKCQVEYSRDLPQGKQKKMDMSKPPPTGHKAKQKSGIFQVVRREYSKSRRVEYSKWVGGVRRVEYSRGRDGGC